MSPNSKDRLINIVAGGIFIPLSYMIALCLLSLFVARDEIQTIAWLGAPILWPAYINDLLVAAFGDSPSGLFILLLPFANFALYALLTYAVIRWRQRMPRLR